MFRWVYSEFMTDKKPKKTTTKATTTKKKSIDPDFQPMTMTIMVSSLAVVSLTLFGLLTALSA